MSSHLSDEAVAAFADGVLRGHPRERAARHVDSCAECRGAVRFQREAVLALRTAPVPSLPSGLFERLQALPSTTPITTLPTVVAADGSTMLATFASASPFPVAAFVPVEAEPDESGDKPGRHGRRTHPFATGAAVVALTAGALAAGAVASTPDTAPTTSDTIRTVNSTNHGPGAAGGVPAPAVVEGFVAHR